MTNFSEDYNIVYASDDKFSEIMGISILSLLEKNQNVHSISIYILDMGILEENKKKVEEVCNRYTNVLLYWVQAINVEHALNMRVKTDRGSLGQYARLFVSSLLPSEVKRVLYLDCDIVIMDSIKELWNLNLNGNTIGALMDAFSKYYRANIDLHSQDIMFNSGVMLIDLELWKERKIEEKLKQFIRDRKGVIQQGDQGALNAVLSKETYCFSPRFNSVTIFFDFNYQEILKYRKPSTFYTQIEIKEAVENPVIVHFTTSFLSKRPWIKGCQHQYVDIWLKYKEMSPWKENDLLEEEKKSVIQEVYIEIITKVPRNIMIFISGLLQIYGRPLLYKCKKIKRRKMK